jgi:hypothetical protein
VDARERTSGRAKLQFFQRPPYQNQIVSHVKRGVAALIYATVESTKVSFIAQTQDFQRSTVSIAPARRSNDEPGR